MIFQAAEHKFLDGSNDIFDSKTVERIQVNFVQKVRAIAEIGDGKTVFTQEEFFDEAS